MRYLSCSWESRAFECVFVLISTRKFPGNVNSTPNAIPPFSLFLTLALSISFVLFLKGEWLTSTYDEHINMEERTAGVFPAFSDSHRILRNLKKKNRSKNIIIMTYISVYVRVCIVMYVCMCIYMKIEYNIKYDRRRLFNHN